MAEDREQPVPCRVSGLNFGTVENDMTVFCPQIQDVLGLGRFNISALDQDIPCTHVVELSASITNTRFSEEVLAGEHAGFMDIGCDQFGDRKDLASNGVNGILLEQNIPAGRHHDGIQDHWNSGVFLQKRADPFSDFAAVKHADLDGVDFDVIKNALELGLDEGDWNRMESLNSLCVLGGDGGDGG